MPSTCSRSPLDQPPPWIITTAGQPPGGALPDQARFVQWFVKRWAKIDVVNAVERVTGLTVPVEHQPRRPGDPPAVVADSGRLKSALGWTPQYAALDTIVDHAFRWEQSLPG